MTALAQRLGRSIYTNTIVNDTHILPGFHLEGAGASEFVLPPNWDATSANGLFTATYRHENDVSIPFAFQVRSLAAWHIALRVCELVIEPIANDAMLCVNDTGAVCRQQDGGVHL